MVGLELNSGRSTRNIGRDEMRRRKLLLAEEAEGVEDEDEEDV